MNKKTLEETRRELFEALPDLGCLDRGHGVYENPYVESAWFGFNAALDAVENGFVSPVAVEYDECIEDCRAAIESTNLGVKVK